MNNNTYRWILYTIVAVIVATIGIQVYWNYKNYLANKQQLINEVQISLDKAVDDYYTALAERTTVGVFIEEDQQKDVFGEGSQLQKILKNIDDSDNPLGNLDSLDVESIKGVSIFKGYKADSMSKRYDELHKTFNKDTFKKRMDSIKLNGGKIEFSNFEILTSKVMISISNDSLDIEEVDSLFNNELARKNIDIKSKLVFHQENMKNGLKKEADSVVKVLESKNKYNLSTTSKSTFLPKESKLKVEFTNETSTVLKRSLGGILISTLLIAAVISSLFYLLKIIKHQKQLAEVKNDLISNITHEFKTPIATIGVALESINNFNAIEDKEKAKKYINMSSDQLSKLNIMVEKLLETATLDSENLELNKEQIDIVDLLKSLVDRYKIQFAEKQFNTSFKVESLEATVDVFHFENALNNILDNAVKYGGNLISVDLFPKKNTFEIVISDNGSNLSKASKERIFEKFYRVPKGNTHDVKGFGIGLYYTKTIIEKHSGSIIVDVTKDLTIFKITLPNG